MISPIDRAVTGLDRRAHGGFFMLDQEERWLTYAEVGELLSISAEAARALARRQKWARRTPNEHNALARVLVPPDRPTARPRPAVAQWTNGGHPGDARGAEERRPAEHDRPGDTPGVLRSAVRALESAVEGLREQLQTANQRTEQAERRADNEQERADRERERADRIEQQLTKVEGELIASRVEAASLQCQLEQARPKPPPAPPRSPWRRFLAWRR